MIRGIGIYNLYKTGGTNHLAYRLGRIFTKIETDEQRILHNDVLAEVMDIINKTHAAEAGRLNFEERSLLQFIAEWLVYHQFSKENKKKRFLFRLADRVLQMGQAK